MAQDSAEVRETVLDLLRAALAPLAGVAPEQIGADSSLEALGLDSMNVVEALISVRDELFEREGVDPEDVEDPDRLPALDTVGDLVDFVVDQRGP